jgi:RNA polymerase sigma-70 factor (ECF subfamily)
MLAFEKLPDRTTVSGVGSIIFKNAKSKAQLEKQFLLGNQSQSDSTDFWKLWGQHQDYLYQRCLTWMGSNPTDAQEALSRASIKAWEKWQDYPGKITNPRAWVTRLTYNLCMDMHRERNREARVIDSLEAIAVAEDEYGACSVPSPESAILDQERDAYIRRAVDALPAKVRIPLSLRYYQEMSYPDIAEQLALSNDNVRKRVQQARTILQKQLNQYFSGLDDSELREHNPPTPSGVKEGGAAFPSPKRREVGEGVKPHIDVPTLSIKMPMNAGCNSELISYKVVATCLELLSHACYSSSSSLEWR